jgi:hypothetical protein
MPFEERPTTMVLGFSDAQLAEIRMSAAQLPPWMRSAYLCRLVALLPNDFGDGDVHRAAIAAARQLLELGRKAS